MISTSLIWILLFFSACSPEDIQDDDTQTEELPLVYQKFSESVNVYIDGDFVVIETNNVPNHPSPYFNTSNSLYEAYNGDNPNFAINPNRISEQDFTYKIPLNPMEASTKSNTQLGSMGVALNGVAIFNQYAGPNNQPLTNEINSFDQYSGHPQQQGVYHYHVEPTYLTSSTNREALIGFLLDGFPVYGPEEDGATVTNANLDEYHGHFGETEDYPEGIYHYHITSEAPYINGGKFFGIAGTISQ